MSIVIFMNSDSHKNKLFNLMDSRSEDGTSSLELDSDSFVEYSDSGSSEDSDAAWGESCSSTDEAVPEVNRD